MLASLLLNYYAGQSATVVIGNGVIIRVIPHTVSLLTEYLDGQDQWRNPQGHAPTHPLAMIVEKAAEVSLSGQRREAPKPRRASIEVVWSSEVHAQAAVHVRVKNGKPKVETGQTLELITGAPVRAKTARPAIHAAWAATLEAASVKRLRVNQRQVDLSIGADINCLISDYMTVVCNPPQVTAVINPTDEELLLMAGAMGRL